MKNARPRSNRDWEKWAARRRAETPEIVTKISKSYVWIIFALVPIFFFLSITLFLDYPAEAINHYQSRFSLIPENLPIINSTRSLLSINTIAFDIVVSFAVLYGLLLGVLIYMVIGYSLLKSEISTLCELFHLKPYFLPILVLFSGFLVLGSFTGSEPESIHAISRFSRLALGSWIDLSFYGYIIFIATSGLLVALATSFHFFLVWILCLFKEV